MEEEEEEDDDSGAVRGDAAGRMSAVGIFWLTALVLSGLAVVVGFEVAARNGANNFTGRAWFVGVAYAIFLPAVLLAAALVTAFILGVSRREDKRYQFSRLASITIGTIVGMIIGGLPMSCCLVVFIRK
jgi:hypothetical protein